MNIVLRPAHLDDTQFIWDCRQTLAQSVARQRQTTEHFSNHTKWMKAALLDENRFFFIVVANGHPAGYTRFDPHPTRNGWLVSILILTKFQGTGLGKKALALGCQIADQSGVTPLFADIHISNQASKAVFETCDFKLVHDNNPGKPFQQYERKIKVQRAHNDT